MLEPKDGDMCSKKISSGGVTTLVNSLVTCT